MQAGQQIRDYVLEEKIGAGGMGEVWRARHQGLQRRVAIKVVHRDLSHQEGFQERFTREAQAMASLEHPHIVPVHDFFLSNGGGFLVMTCIEGGSLEDRGKLDLNTALQISREILDALDFAHQQGVIHRDVKPSNILVDSRGHAYMMDFGIALVAGKERITRLTREGTAVGTPEYMSPEQITHPADIDHRTDVYSFGCVLYEMLVGQPPFGSRDKGSTEFDLMESHVKKQPTPIRRFNAAVDKHTEFVVMRALAKDRDKRFGGCGEMRRALSPADWSGPPPPDPSLLSLLFSFKGRIRRLQYWKGSLILAAVTLLNGVMVQGLSDIDDPVFTLAVFVQLFCLWPGLALCIKRWHDRNRSGWWLLTFLIPILQIIPIIWVGIENGFLRGSRGPNRFGPDPLQGGFKHA